MRPLILLSLVVWMVVVTGSLSIAEDPSPRRNKCRGSSTCQVCENCHACEYCSKEGHSCGVKRSDELRKRKEQRVDRREERRQRREERARKRRDRRERRRQHRNR